MRTVLEEPGGLFILTLNHGSDVSWPHCKTTGIAAIVPVVNLRPSSHTLNEATEHRNRRFSVLGVGDSSNTYYNVNPAKVTRNDDDPPRRGREQSEVAVTMCVPTRTRFPLHRLYRRACRPVELYHAHPCHASRGPLLAGDPHRAGHIPSVNVTRRWAAGPICHHPRRSSTATLGSSSRRQWWHQPCPCTRDSESSTRPSISSPHTQITKMQRVFHGNDTDNNETAATLLLSATTTVKRRSGGCEVIAVYCSGNQGSRR